MLNNNSNDPKAKEKILSSAPTTEDEQDLIHNDYQLYAALTILKGLAIAHR
ncbi:hypothetical protein GCM10010885_24760 [Alicyclobacillus cellulosilyticus]|uniref:Uncharacterized protein n=1 Tax=Alicyclobacillus cellulosilyticus TaxID=1003997 RepID=A0A917KHQ4_9BACL|nr:hypothetical protein GCM10010885_24760 [Alicyclobacillus cellulosilyticus]